MSQYLAANGYPKLLVWIWILGGIISIAISSILIPKFYAIGAAVSLSMTYIILVIMVIILAYQHQSKSERNLLIGAVT